MCPDFSPPVHHGNDDLSYKSKNTVNTGPGVVCHADLARMFPTPPSLENHPHSPSTNSVGDQYYQTNPTVPSATTPPECERHSGVMGYGDIVKTEEEKRKDILAALKVKQKLSLCFYQVVVVLESDEPGPSRQSSSVFGGEGDARSCLQICSLPLFRIFIAHSSSERWNIPGFKLEKKNL